MGRPHEAGQALGSVDDHAWLTSSSASDRSDAVSGRLVESLGEVTHQVDGVLQADRDA